MAVITIEISQNDIDEGQTCIEATQRVHTCPVFKGTKRVLPSALHVGTQTIYLESGQVISLPKEIQRYIKQADVQALVKQGVIPNDPNDINMEPLKPIKFQVRYDEDYQE